MCTIAEICLIDGEIARFEFNTDADAEHFARNVLNNGLSLSHRFVFASEIDEVFFFPCDDDMYLEIEELKENGEYFDLEW